MSGTNVSKNLNVFFSNQPYEGASSTEANTQKKILMKRASWDMYWIWFLH